MLEKVKNFLKSNNNGFIVLFLICIVGAFLAGRSSAPTKIVETQKVVIQEKETIKVVEVEKVIIEKAKDSTEAKRIHKERTEETRPDGTKIVKETTDINVDKTVKEVEVKFVDRNTVIEKEKIVEKEIEVVKIVESKKPDWTGHLIVGSTLNPTLQPGIPYVNPLLVGVGLNRRIVGPAFVGIWGIVNTTGTKPDNTSLGISLSVEW